MRDVAFSCDNDGAKYLCVSVWSLLSHYRGDQPIRVNVLEGFGGHSAENKRRLAEIVGRFPNASVRYVNVEPAVGPYAELIMHRKDSRWNVFSWTSVFTPQLLPDVVGNVAHFDIDMLFNDDVSKILDVDLGDNLLAAVYEEHRHGDARDHEIWKDGILPPEAERSFNAGLLVFNAAKCREERSWERLVDWYRANYDIAERIEQDALNALYWKRVRPLPVRWNFYDRVIPDYARMPLRERYWFGNPPKDCLEAAIKPAILHFWGSRKPWKPGYRPCRKLYHAAMRAVGLVPPKDPVSAPYHDLISAFYFGKIRWRYRAICKAHGS